MVYEICKLCSKMFEKNGKSYCGDCIEKVEKEHDSILEYLRVNPGATILEIITETGVSLKSIDSLVESGYVSYKENKLEPIDSDDLERLTKDIMDRRGQFYITRRL